MPRLRAVYRVARRWRRDPARRAVGLGVLATLAGVTVFEGALRVAEAPTSVSTAVRLIGAGVICVVWIGMAARAASAVRDRERRDAEQASTLADAVLDAISDPIYVMDRNYTVLRANAGARRHFGENLLGQSCYRIFACRETPCEGCPPGAGRLPPTGSGFTHAGDHVFHIRAYPLRNAQGETTGIIEYARDVTQERLLESQVAHQEKMAGLGLLAAGLAHEIGNPLTAMSSLIQLLSRRHQTTLTPEQFELLATHVERISRIVRDMTNFARPVRREPAFVQLGHVATAAAAFIRYDPRCKHVEIRTRFDDSLPALELVEDRILQVCLNLMFNALDAMPSGGTLTLATARRGDEFVLEIQDTGSGIPAQILPHIFEPFFTTKGPGRGTGLGLSVTYSIVHQLGGRIEVDSRVAEGSCFRVVLPIRTAPRSVPLATLPAGARSASRG